MVPTRSKKSQKILIIENDYSNRLLVERILSTYGYRYISVANGRDALEILAREAVDLILTDLSMPGIDGYRIASMIRALPRFANTPIVAVTGMQYERQKALGVGCTDLVAKPYRPKELLEVIARHLNVPMAL